MAIRLSENFRALFYAPFYAAHAIGAYDAEDVAVELVRSRREELLRMTRAMARTLRWIATTPGIDVARTLRDFFPDVAPDIFAAVIDRYRALGLFATDPVLQREGFDRLQAAMLSGGAIAREIPYADCVDNSLAEQTVRSAGG